MALTVGLRGAAVALQAGDVLLERNHGTATHAMITTGQTLGSIVAPGRRLGGVSTSKTVHAAIDTGDTAAGGMVSESVGSGVRENEIGPGRPANKRVEWKVYRFFDDAVAEMAVDVSLELVKKGFEDPNRFGGGGGTAYGSYTKGASFASAFSGASNPIGGAADANFASVAQQRGFFCSNFVAACFAVASELLQGNSFYAIPKNMEQVNPAELDSYLKSAPGAWTRLGGAQVYLDA